MQVAFQLWYRISMPICIANCCSNSCLVSISSYWSCSIFKEWDDDVFCWFASSFSCSKFLTLTFNCSNCFHYSTTSHSTFSAHDSIVSNCPYNSMICSFVNLALAFSCATYVWVWCSTFSPSPHLSMTFVMASSRLFESTTWFVWAFSNMLG